MKTIALSLLAAIAISNPAYALSWKDKMFAQLDTDHSGELSYGELVAAGCRTDLKYFKIADEDHSGGLSKLEYFENREILGRCK